MKKSSKNSNKLILSLLIGGSALAIGMAPHYASAKTLSPKGGWQILNYENPTNSKSSYCALSKQYDDDIALTFGKNLMDEYSAALDFTKPNLDTNRAYNIMMSPGNNQMRAYDIMPASRRAFVINLGGKDDLFKTLRSSELLKVEIDGKKYEFNIPDMSVGQKQLNDCVAGLKGYDEGKKFASKSGFSAEKEKPSEPIKAAPVPVEKSDPIVVSMGDMAPDVKEIIIDKPVARKTNAALDQEIKIAPIETFKDVTKEVSEEMPKKSAIVEIDDSAFFPEPAIELEEEIIVSEVKPFEAPIIAPAPIVAPSPIIETIKEEIDTPRNVIKQPKTIETPAVKANVSPMVAPKIEMADEGISIADETVKKEGTVSRALGGLASLKNKVLPTKPEKKPDAPMPVIETTAPAIQTPAKTIEAPAPIIEMAKVAEPEIKAQYFPETEPAPKAVMPEKVAALSTENSSLKGELSVLKEDLEALKKEQADKKAKREEQSKKIDIQKDNEEKAARDAMMARIATLEAENKKFYEDAKSARNEIDNAVIEVANQALVKTQDIQNQLEAAKADNLRLSKQLEEANKIQENALVNAAVDDPNLQRTIKRNNEAERELKRLGSLMEQQRLSWEAEKKELEKMLFDPALTDEKQRKKLADLESKLSSTQEQLTEAKAYADKAAKERIIVTREAPSKAPVAIASLANDNGVAPRANLYEQNPLTAQRPVAQKTLTERPRVSRQDLSPRSAPQPLTPQVSQRDIEMARAAKTQAEALAKTQAETQAQLQALMKAQAQTQNQTQAQLQQLAQAQKMAQEQSQALAKAEQIARASQSRILQAEAREAEARAKLQAAASQQALAREQAIAREQTVTRESQARLLEAKAREAEARAKLQAATKASQARILEAEAREAEARSKLQAVAREQAMARQQAASAPAPVAKAMPRYQLSQNNIQSLLSRSGVPLNGAVVRVAEDQYRWDAANIIGKAYVGKSSEVGGIQNFAQETIAKAKKACGGDFAAIPASSNRFEMACIGGVYSSSASLVLHQKGQEIIAITHETSADDMDIAMDIGDKIARNLSAL